jgi:signal transduction histidine kinase
VTSYSLALERALDVVSDVFVVFDRDFRLVYHNEPNRAAMRVAGMDPEAAIGKYVLDAMPQLAGTAGFAESGRALRERVATQWEESYGPEVRLRGRAFPTEDGGIIVVATNVTAEWNALETARLARHTAEEANRAKTDFLAAMSHELRTPLNAIGGYTEMLLLGIRGAINDQQRQDLQRVARNQEHLLGIITDILNFARIEAGAIDLDLTSISTEELVADIEPLIAIQLSAKGLTFSIDCADPAPALRADREKTRQILLNLLGNAAKFTTAGGSVRLSVASANGAVHIRVHDTGIGIPADKLEAIFEPFVQAHRSLTQSTAGTGLGLAISRDLARRMGGDVAVESVVGAGSTFTLSLPRS